MAQLDFYYDQQKVNEDILNWRDLEIEVNFDQETGQGTVQSGSLEFTGALADKINTWNANGMNGGPGIFEAPLFRIDVCGGSTIFNGGINVADCSTTYECDKVVAPLRTDRIDFLNDRASSFSFKFLAQLTPNSPGRITQLDYVSVPYVINSIPDFVNVMVAGLGLFTLVKELKSVISKLVIALKKLIGDVVACVGAFVPPTTVVGIAMAIGHVLVDILNVFTLILYAVFIIKALIEFFMMVLDNLIQRTKYKKGMKVLTSFQKACDFLGYQFSSTILTTFPHKDEVIIPRKTSFTDIASHPDHDHYIHLTTVFGFPQGQKDRDDLFNPKSTGCFDGTFADLILLYEDRFNAEIRIINNTLHFETKDYWALHANYTLPDIQRKGGDPHKTNACELASNYIITHALDDAETNTYDQYTGTSCQMTLNPGTFLNKKNILLKNLVEKNLPVALAKRKLTLNGIETLFANMFSTLSNLITGGNSMFQQAIQNFANSLSSISPMTGGSNPVVTFLSYIANPYQTRVGMMLLSHDNTGVPKVLIVDSSNKLITTNEWYTSAQYLMDTFHYTEFAVRTTDSFGQVKNDHNQWLIYEDKEIPLCCEDYLKIINNNYIKTYDQKTAKIKKLIWNPYKGTARITYRVKEQYTKNLKNSYIINGKPL